MAAKKDFMSKLLAAPGAVQGDFNPHSYVIRSPSPSLNFIFGNSQGLPAGYSVLLYGPPRGGKSIIANAMAGQLHQDDPDAWVVKYNTEFRERGQLTPEQARVWGIDLNRYVAYERNDPELFDHIERDLAALVDEGMKLKLVIIDSQTQIQGRRGMNADTIMTQQIGDNAATVQEGLKRILPVQRKHGFALITTSHIRSQIEQGGKSSAVVNTSRTTSVRPAVSYGTQHHCEYYLYVNPATGEESKVDLLKKKVFEDDSVRDFDDHSEKTGHKVRVRMMDSSLGPKGRAGEFSFDYRKGIFNTHEEVFLLGTLRGIIDRPNQLVYRWAGLDYKGKEAMLEAIKNHPEIRKDILNELMRRDLSGSITLTDEEKATVATVD
jgi:RecA/RadA recombinase